MDDGTTFDLTAYDAFDVLLSFRDGDHGEPQFIDVAVFEPT